MFTQESQDLLAAASKTTAAVARKLGSTKNDLEDLHVLAETLELLSRTVRTVARTELLALQ